MPPAAPRGVRRILLAEGADGSPACRSLPGMGPASAYDLMGGSDPSLRTQRGDPLLTWEAINAGQVTRRYDFEGSMLRRVERFVRAFGGRQVQFRASHAPPAGQLALMAYDLHSARKRSPPMPSLVVTHPPGREQERQYVCDVVLRDWLGLDYATEAQSDGTSDHVAGDPDARALHLPDVFFPQAAAAWLEPASLPAEPAGAWPVEGGAHGPMRRSRSCSRA